MIPAALPPARREDGESRCPRHARFEAEGAHMSDRMARIRADEGARWLARWGLDRTGTRARVARHAGVDRSRVSHWWSDDDRGPVTRTLRLIAQASEDEQADARALVTAAETTWELHALVGAPTGTLLSRWAHLLDRRHRIEARERRLWTDPRATRDAKREAALDLVTCLAQMAALDLELEGRGIDPAVYDPEG